MFKGLAALFTSGIIFNPMVLMGVILGFYCSFTLEAEQIYQLFGNYHFYFVILAISIIYHFSFKKVYKGDYEGLDYSAMVWQIIGDVFKFVFATVLSICFLLMISF